MAMRNKNMQTVKVCLFSLLACLFFLSFAEGRPVVGKLAEKPKGTIKTIKAKSGDVIDCVDIYKQPAFDHPLMKDHILQLKPSSTKHQAQLNNDVVDSLFDVSWRKDGGCPDGSVPIVRQVLTGYPIIGKNLSFAEPQANGHQYAVIFYQNGQPTMQGAKATISIWNPQLALPNTDFSLSQIWITAGGNSGNQLQTIEAGWQVFPGRTGSPGPKLFVFWTADGYASTGCYDLTCPGWVLTSNQYSPGMSLTPSTAGGQQQELQMDIERDGQTGNWWFYLGGQAIGYWPPSVYNGGLLGTSGSDTLSWGGEIYDSSGSNGFHTLTQMGSGQFPSAGYGQASYVRDLFYTDSSGNSNAPTQDQLPGQAPAPNCYNYQFQQGSSELYFYYGGPGCN